MCQNVIIFVAFHFRFILLNKRRLFIIFLEKYKQTVDRGSGHMISVFHLSRAKLDFLGYNEVFVLI